MLDIPENQSERAKTQIADSRQVGFRDMLEPLTLSNFLHSDGMPIRSQKRSLSPRLHKSITINKSNHKSRTSLERGSLLLDQSISVDSPAPQKMIVQPSYLELKIENKRAHFHRSARLLISPKKRMLKKNTVMNPLVPVIEHINLFLQHDKQLHFLIDDQLQQNKSQMLAGVTFAKQLTTRQTSIEKV